MNDENILETQELKAQNCDGACTRNLPEEPDEPGLIDQAREKLISRKLLVFLTATGLLASSNLDASTWGMIAMCYIGGQSIIDFAKIWKGI